jgi:branched-chain amino acid aminotransferase
MDFSVNYEQYLLEPAYRSPSNQILLFRVPMHGQRMAKSAEFVSIPPLPLPLFRQSLHLAVSKNAEFVPPPESGAALYIRPVMIGFSPSLLPSPPTEYLFYIFVQPLAPLHGTHASEAILLEEYDRSAPKGTGAVKVGGNYAPLMRWTGKAAREGYSLILHIDSQTRTKIDEFSTAGFIGVRKNREGMGDGVTVVISSSENIIQSVTTDSVAVIAASMGWKVERRAVSLLPSNRILLSNNLFLHYTY